jgi:hypothetical protein
MEKIMSKITVKTEAREFAPDELNHGALADTELNAVAGGMLYLAAPQKPVKSPPIFPDHADPIQFF